MARQLNYFRTRSKVAELDLSSYLEKLRLSKEEPSLKYLKKIHRAHLLSIPFENLDIHYGHTIELNPVKLYQKIISKNRGGFCYELNGLLYHLLGGLGFDCYLISVEVFKEGVWSPLFDHMAIVAAIDNGLWLLDVGFGDLMLEPKKLQAAISQLDYTTYFKLEQDINQYWILKKSRDNSLFETVYRFKTDAKEFIEFMPRCQFHQEDVTSQFKQNKIITQQLQNGRITLTDQKLKQVENGEIHEYNISNEDDFLAKLDQHFGITLHDLIHRR